MHKGGIEGTSITSYTIDLLCMGIIWQTVTSQLLAKQYAQLMEALIAIDLFCCPDLWEIS